MQKLLAKKLNKKGFTLAELLIVVAIIAVLVAIAIPIFTGAMEKARLGVHRSNARNLKSMAVAAILADKGFETNVESASGWKVLGVYDFETQKLTISKISAVTDDFSASTKMGVSAGEAAIDADAAFTIFGASDDAIGKIGTNGKVSYYVEVNSNDLSGVSVSWS